MATDDEEMRENWPELRAKFAGGSFYSQFPSVYPLTPFSVLHRIKGSLEPQRTAKPLNAK